MNSLLLAAAATSEESETTMDLLGRTGVFTVVGAIVVAAVTFAFGVLSTRRRERRDRYAEMTAALAAWAEMPFRIRRRTSDDPATVAALVARMSDLQEQFRRDQAYLRAECGWLADRRDAVQKQIQAGAAGAFVDAWTCPPCTSASDQNLGDWGPRDLYVTLNEFSCELRWRFGFRRLINPLRRGLSHGQIPPSTS